MENNLTQQVQKRLQELPDDVRRAVQSADLGKKVREIGTKHQLHIDQSALLEEETLLVMLGFSDPNNLHQQIASRVRVSPQEAASITEDLTKEIFMPIRESMKRFMEERAEDLEAESSAAAVLASAPPAQQKAAPAPITPSPAAPAAPQAPKPVVTADLALTQKTVNTPPKPAPASSTTPAAPAPTTGTPKPPAPPKPGGYNADPYREPPE